VKSDAGSRWFASLTVVLALSAFRPAFAQSTAGSALEVLNHRLHQNDIIFVTARETGETRGAFVSASATSLVIAAAAGGLREIPAQEILSVEKSGDPVWNGAIIGGVILGLGMGGGAGASCSPNCASAVAGGYIFGAALGAGIGATIDYLHKGRTLVYGVRPGSRPAPPAAPAVPATVPPAVSLATLSTRVKPGDPVSVVITGGTSIDGEFTRVSAASLTLTVSAQAREIPAGDVQRVVRKRGGNHLKRGLLIGAPIGALAGSASCYQVDTFTHPADEGLSCGQGVLLGTVIGTGLGGLLGSVVWSRTVVFDATHDPESPPPAGASVDSPRQTRFMLAPLIARRGAGLAVSLAF
jgi:hypothetical protein